MSLRRLSPFQLQASFPLQAPFTLSEPPCFWGFQEAAGELLGPLEPAAKLARRLSGAFGALGARHEAEASALGAKRARDGKRREIGQKDKKKPERTRALKTRNHLQPSCLNDRLSGFAG